MAQSIKGEKNIKTTVFISYALLIVVISSILFFTFNSFQKLTRSTDSLAQPNHRIILLHNIMFSIYNAESNIRSYSLNQREVHLNNYFDELSNLNELVDSLYLLSGDDDYFKQTLDSINLQLFSKTKLLEKFINLKKQDQNSVFYERALDEIIQVTEEETKLREVSHQIITDFSSADTLQISQDEIRQEKENFFTRIRSFFTGRRDDSSANDQDRQEKDKLQAERLIQQIRTDSVITTYRDTVNLKSDIENAFVNLMQSVLEQQQNINRIENQILSEDKEIMDRIWKYITVLEEYEQTNAWKEAGGAHSTVNETTRKVFFVVLFSLLILLIFSWLFVHDVNKSKYYRKQLLQEKTRAEQLLLIKQRFMANISHEIRTPLNSIMGFSNQLDKIELEQKHKTFLNAISQSSSHLLGIVNDILDFSRIEAGKINLEIIPVNIIELAEELSNSLSVLAIEKNLEFEVDTSSLKNPWVLGDPLRLKQILLNIAGNAIKFTQQGKVRVVFSDQTKNEKPGVSYLKIEVIDTGIGISASEQELIFEEFVQADNQAARQYGGTGLGLSISKKLVEMMAGNIGLASQPGKGSTFTISIPLRCTDKPVFSETTLNASIPAIMVPRILVVDDDKLNRLLIKSILEQHNIISLEAEEAATALQMLEEQKFDLIIADIQMPGMSGVDMIKALRNKQDQMNQTTPVLMCTADVTPETLKEIKNSGMDDYILKPFNEIQFMKKIAEILKFNEPDKNPAEISDNSLSDQNAIEHAESESDKLYDLQGLRAFTGNDLNNLISILNSFTEDTKRNVKKLKRYLRRTNPRAIHMVVHKMSNMFGLLKITATAAHFENLNDLKNTGREKGEIIENTRQIIRISTEVIITLKDELDKLSQ